MKAVIDGVAYNTETATPIARRRHIYDVPAGQEEVQTIYQTRGGALFEHHMIAPKGEEPLEKIKPFSQAALKRCIEAGWDALPGATRKAEVSTTLYLRLPASLKARLERAATAEGQSANTWAMRCLERCLGDLPGDTLDGHKVHIEAWTPKGTWRVAIDGVVRGLISYGDGVWNFFDNEGNDLERSVAKLDDAPKLALELWRNKLLGQQR